MEDIQHRNKKDNIISLKPSSLFELLHLLDNNQLFSLFKLKNKKVSYVLKLFVKHYEIMNIENIKEIKSEKRHSDWVKCFEFDEKNKYLISGSWDKTINIMNSESLLLINTLNDHTDTVTSLALYKNKNILFSGSRKEIRVWDLKTFQCIKTINAGNGYFDSLVIYEENNILISGNNPDIFIYDLNIYDHITTIKGHINYIRCLVIYI